MGWSEDKLKCDCHKVLPTQAEMQYWLHTLCVTVLAQCNYNIDCMVLSLLQAHHPSAAEWTQQWAESTKPYS